MKYSQTALKSSSFFTAWENSGGLKALGQCTQVGGLEEALVSWLWISSGLATVAILGKDQKVEIFFSPSCDISIQCWLLFSIQLPVTIPGKAAKDGMKAQVFVTNPNGKTR